MRYDFMMAGNELAGPAPKRRPQHAPAHPGVVKVAANTTTLPSSSPAGVLATAFGPKPAMPAPKPRKPKVIYDTVRLPVRGSVPLPVDGGVRMQGPKAVRLHDAKPTVPLSRALGTKLALAGMGLGALDPRLGKQIRATQSTHLSGRKTTVLPVSTGNFIPGLAGEGGFIPGLAGGGFMPGLGALDRRIPGPKTRKLVARQSVPTAQSAGKMLPGLSCDDPDHVVSVGHLGAADLYDQMDGVGMNAWSGMPTPGMSAPGMPGLAGTTLPIIGELTAPKMVAAAALVAFFMMARKRYA